MIEAKRYYVYGLIDPKTKEPFYVGKGKGDRALHHLSENENINEAKQRRIKEIENFYKKNKRCNVNYSLINF